MLEILYFIFIFPIQSLLDMLLSLFFSLTQSYGVSLIFLSLSVQIFLLKLTGYFERKTALFNALKASVNAKREEFKRVFKGSELLSYTRILYKQRHFHPIFALFGLGGLALQIPIFIALIVLVQEAEFLKGVGFLWLSDLSQADRLNAQVFGLSLNVVHILPILMCALSVANVLYQSKEKGEVIQGLSLALIFLVLLYDMPSALVLYWSTNMLFALLKALWQKQAQTRKQEGEKEGKRRQGQNAQAYQETLHDKKRISQAERLQGGLEEAFKEGCASRTFEADALHRSEALGCKADTQERREQVSEKGETNKRDGESQNQGFYQKRLIKEAKSNTQGVRLTWWQRGRGFIKHSFQALFTPYENLSAKEYKTYRDISILALVNICFMICVFSPFAVYSSDVSQFDPNQTYQTLGALFGVFLLSSLLLVYITSFFYQTRFLKLGAYGVSVILLIGVVYTFVLRGDYKGRSYGTLENFVFQGGAPVYDIINKWFDLFYVGLSLLVCAGAFFYVSTNKVRKTLALISVFLFCYGSLYTVKIHFSIQHHQSFSASTNPPSYNDKLLAFSKEKNVLVLILDAFTGSHFKIILDHDQSIKQILNGFTYYDNTLATSNNTQFNTPAILGGHSYTTLNLIKEGVRSTKEKYLEAFLVLPKALQNNGWNIAMYGTDPVEPQDLRKALNKEAIIADYTKENYTGTYINHYQLNSYIQNTSQEYRQRYNSVGTLLSIGLFRTFPYSIRSRIYVDERWLFSKENPLDDFFTQIKYVSDLAMFPYLSNTTSETKTFKYIKTLSTHFPWYLDSANNCLPNIDTKSQLPDPYRNITPKEYINAYNNNHYNNELCAIDNIKKWILWLKKEKIYDNTAIIIASDHGHYDSFKQIQNNKGDQLGKQSDALLLIKPIKNNAPLTIDHQLMSNADIYAILCSITEISCKDQNPLLHPNQKRVLHHSNSPFEETLRIDRSFAVENDIYHPENWREITIEDGHK